MLNVKKKVRNQSKKCFYWQI